MDGLTKQERRVVLTILALLLLGGAVKVYRSAHPEGHAPRPALGHSEPSPSQP